MRPWLSRCHLVASFWRVLYGCHLAVIFLFGVWGHVALVKSELLAGKYKRPMYRRPWVHGCLHCGRLIATGWSVMVGDPGNKRNHPTKGSWQSSKVLDHLRVCQNLPEEFAHKLHKRDAGTKQIKEEKGLHIAATTSMHLKMGGGEVVFSSTLLPSAEIAARVAIARCIMYLSLWQPTWTWGLSSLQTKKSRYCSPPP